MPRSFEFDLDSLVIHPASSDGQWLLPGVAWRAAWQDRWAQLHGLTRQAAPGGPMAGALGLALHQGFVLSRTQALAAGVDNSVLRTLLRRRIWSRPGRGMFGVLHPRGDRNIAAALSASAAAAPRPKSAVSHSSAAVLHGLPLASMPARPVLTVAGHWGGGRPGSTSLQRAQLDADETVEWFGIPVTSVARTVADLARNERGDALMAADAALRGGLVSVRDLERTVATCRGWPGIANARWVIEHADPLSESPLESLTRACLLEYNVPKPILQGQISDPTDGWRCRVDMLWREQMVVLEADGGVKYDDNGRALWQEKKRQERLERLGYRVVRVLWRDVVEHPADTAARVLGALRRPR